MNFSLYVHGYFIPWLEQEREAGRLTKGENFLIEIILFPTLGDKHITVNRTAQDGTYRYIGEVDCFGRPCGFGTAVNLKDDER